MCCDLHQSNSVNKIPFPFNHSFAFCEMTEKKSPPGELHFKSLWQEKCVSSHMERKIHLFHSTKKSFSLLNVLPLTGEVMGLDHVHLHAAVNQEFHSPHAAKTPNSSSSRV